MHLVLNNTSRIGLALHCVSRYQVQGTQYWLILHALACTPTIHSMLPTLLVNMNLLGDEIAYHYIVIPHTPR